MTTVSPARVGPNDCLTDRETQILQLIANGLGNREIGQSLWISDETVKSHVSRLLVKLQATTRANAVAIAIRRGLIR